MPLNIVGLCPQMCTMKAKYWYRVRVDRRKKLKFEKKLLKNADWPAAN